MFLTRGSDIKNCPQYLFRVCFCGSPTCSCQILLLEDEDLLDGGTERSGHPVGELQGGIVLPLLEEDDRLPPDPDLLRQLLLGDPRLRPEFPDPRLHPPSPFTPRPPAGRGTTGRAVRRAPSAGWRRAARSRR